MFSLDIEKTGRTYDRAEREESVRHTKCITEQPASLTLDFFPLLPLLFYILSLYTTTLLSPVSLHSLHPLFFISIPLTVPWHSKAPLPSLTLSHGATDDNNWFENRRQWDTRIIPDSQPPPTTSPPLHHTHPKMTSLLCILHFLSTSLLPTPTLIFLPFSFLLLVGLPFKKNLFLISWSLLHTHFLVINIFWLSLTLFSLLLHIFPERWVPIGINLLFLPRVEVTLLLRAHVHTCGKRVLWNDNDVWLNAVTNVLSPFWGNCEPVTKWWRKSGTEGGVRQGGREWGVRIKKQTHKVCHHPSSPHAEWQRNVKSCRSTRSYCSPSPRFPLSFYLSITFSPICFVLVSVCP